jgi:hypothetical protein
MTKETYRNLLTAILFGIGFSFFICTQFLGLWETTIIKGIFLLSGIFLVVSTVYFLIFEFIHRNGFKKFTARSFSAILLLAIAFSGILLLIFPFPERLTPDASQFIVIKPVQDTHHPADANKILVEEIRINGKPISLIDIIPSAGWHQSPFGLESEPGNLNPLVIRNKGNLQSDILIQFIQGPLYGSAQIRMGWFQQQKDFYQSDADAETVVSIPKASTEFWWTGLSLSLWISLAGIILLLLVLTLPDETMRLIPERLPGILRSVLFWVVLSTLFWYCFSFVRPVFFNASHVMQNENFLPAIRPIGNDLQLILNASHSIIGGGSPYAGANKYPPAATVFFLPLTFFNFLPAFQILTVLNYIFFGLITLGLPYCLTNQKKLPSFAWLLFGTGLFSYGLLFEIERGQFNLISMGLVFLSILLFHKTPRYRWLAFILFCIGVQLKIYPAIFVIFLADNWKDWKKTLKRWIFLGLANIALLFILGPKITGQFIFGTTNVISGIGKSDWPLNHSINGFLTFINFYFNLPDYGFQILQTLLIVTTAALIGICFYSAFSRGKILDPYLLLACTLGALLLPTLSNDYTLAYLVGPAIFLLIHLDEESKLPIEFMGKDENRIGILICLSALVLTSTYYSYLQKPIYLQNQFPALFLLLIVLAVFSFKNINHIRTSR